MNPSSRKKKSCVIPKHVPQPLLLRHPLRHFPPLPRGRHPSRPGRRNRHPPGQRHRRHRRRHPQRPPSPSPRPTPSSNAPPPATPAAPTSSPISRSAPTPSPSPPPASRPTPETGNVLEVGSNIAVNVQMTIGAQDQQISVQSEGLALQTEDASFKQTIDQTDRHRDAPQRPSDDLSSSPSPAAPPPPPPATSPAASTPTQTVAVSIAGSGGNTTQWKLDGGDNNDYMANGNLPFPFPTPSASSPSNPPPSAHENGEHSGGLVNVVTRSGSNTYHGTAFEFIRNNIINAPGTFYSASKDSSPPEPVRRNLRWTASSATSSSDSPATSAAKVKSSQSQSSVTAYRPHSQANLAGDFSASDRHPQARQSRSPAPPCPTTRSTPPSSTPRPSPSPSTSPPPATRLPAETIKYADPPPNLRQLSSSPASTTPSTATQQHLRPLLYRWLPGARPSSPPPTSSSPTQSGNVQRVQSFVLGEDFTISSLRSSTPPTSRSPAAATIAASRPTTSTPTPSASIVYQPSPQRPLPRRHQ